MQCLQPSAYILHKESDEDILIDSAQRIPLAFISDMEWQTLKNSCTTDEFRVFSEHYNDAGDIHVLKGIPATITAQESRQYDRFEIDLPTFYNAQDDGSWHIKTALLPASVMTMFKSDGAINSAPKKLLLTDTVDLMQELLARYINPPKAPVFSYIARINTNHFYFYKEPHEHVPGIMLVEMARQAVYHYTYSATEHHRGDITISMTVLDVEFERYIESAYPLEILIYQSDMLFRPRPRTIDKTMVFFQNGKKAAQARIAGSVISSHIFKRLRTLNSPESHWFFLSSRVSHYVLLSNSNGKYKQAVLYQISISGIQIIENNDCFEYSSATLYLENDGFMKLDLETTATAHDTIVELNFKPLTSQQSYQLKEIIKRHGVFNKKHPIINKEQALTTKTLP